MLRCVAPLAIRCWRWRSPAAPTPSWWTAAAARSRSQVAELMFGRNIGGADRA